MTKQEALDKIKELEDYIKKLDEQVGFEDDKIFLLSKEEYERYKNKIPHCSVWWWLRSSGFGSSDAAYVGSGGFVDVRGYSVSTHVIAVRPVIHIKNPYGLSYEIGERIMRKSYPWIVIDEGIAIAETPIAFRGFDKESNDYETSEIRKFLLDWWKCR